MSKYPFTPQAVADLFEIWTFIAQDNPTAADRVEEAVYRACNFLADSPLVERMRKDLTPLPVRFWVVQPYLNYIIVYNPEKEPLQIIRILHSARDLRSVSPVGVRQLWPTVTDSVNRQYLLPDPRIRH